MERLECSEDFNARKVSVATVLFGKTLTIVYSFQFLSRSVLLSSASLTAY